MGMLVGEKRVVFILEPLDAPRQVLHARRYWSLDVYYDVGKEIDPVTGDWWKYYSASPYKTVKLNIDERIYHLSESQVQKGKTPRGRTLYQITEVPSETVWQARAKSLERAMVS